MNQRDFGSSVWVVGEVLMDLIPDGNGARIPIVGGGPANTAKALARLGIATYFIDGISSDEYGQQSRAELHAAGVDLSFSKVSEKPTATATVSMDAEGKATYKFSLTETATFDFGVDWLPYGSPAVLHIGTLATIVAPGCNELYRWVAEVKAPIVFDPNIRPSVISDRDFYRNSVERWMSMSDVIKLSDEDLIWLYPDLTTAEDLIEIARRILSTGPMLVVITRGSAGIIAITSDEVVTVPSLSTNVIDTVGAGDTVGAVIVEGIFHHGIEAASSSKLELILQRAAKAASITCSRAGAQPPSAAELL